jgi:shikimate dehydrogenase
VEYKNLWDDNRMREMSISGKTRLCGLIGDPVEHSMSPAMHNAAFRELGLDFLYLPFRVKREELGKAIEGVRALNIKGLNVTIPHKVAVIQFLDELDPLAEKIGAVNTIVNDDGLLKGYNTDASGFLQTLLERGIEPEGRNIVILGAGGASRAVSFILADRGAHLVILNRLLELDWAEELASRISQIFSKEVEALELNRENLVGALGKADILVNATSVGMSPNIDETPVASDLLRPGLTVFDIVYNPIKTRLLREAEMAGAKTIGGLDMLVWQGALAFEKWTGRKAPIELMKKEAIKLLEKV